MNIFENESAWIYLAYGPNCLGKHVTGIQKAAMFSPEREWLARRPTGDQVDIVEIRVIEFPYISFRYVRPMSYRLNIFFFVQTDRIAGVRIPLHHRFVNHIVTGKPESQSSGASK